MMALAASGDVTIDMMASKDSEVAFGAVSRIGGELLRLAPGVVFDLLQGRGELLYVGGVVAEALRDDDLGGAVYRRLRVVGLHIFFAALAHDAALRIGKVALCFGVRSRLTRGARLGFERLARFPDLRDSLLFVGNPARHLIAAPRSTVQPILRLVGRLRLAEPLANLLFQTLLRLTHPLIAHRLVLARIRLDLRAIQGHVPKLDQPRVLTQRQNLLEQALQSIQVALAKIAHGAKVRSVKPRHRHEVHPLLASACDAAGGIHTLAIRVQQQRRHHHRVVRRVTPLFLLIGTQNRGHIQLLANRVSNEMRDMIGRHKIHHRRRQQPVLLDIPLTKGL